MRAHPSVALRHGRRALRRPGDARATNTHVLNATAMTGAIGRPCALAFWRQARRVVAAFGLTLMLGWLSPAAASAHAQLEGSAPSSGTVLERQPARVVFRFSEPVEANFGAVRVFDASGRRVDEDDAFHPGDRSQEIAVALRDGLPDGTYTATFRVVSADSHVISGGVTFSVGEVTAAGATVDELLAGDESGPVTDVAFGVARGLQFGAVAVAVGLLLFLVLVWRRALRGVVAVGTAWDEASEAFARRLWLVVGATAIVGASSAVLAIVMQGAEAAGTSGFDALRTSTVRETIGTRFGAVWGVGLLAWLLVAAVVAATIRTPQLRWASARGRAPLAPVPRLLAAVALALPCAVLVSVPAAGGHAGAQSPVALLLPANVLHVAAVSLWVGGLAALLLVLPSATRRLTAPADRSRLLAAVLLRFSPLALGAVAVVLGTGILQSALHLDRAGDLLDTGFGRAILAKGVLLLALIGLGAYQRRRSVPRLVRLAASGGTPDGAGVALRRALRAEVVLVLGALAATTFLAALSPTPVSEGPIGSFEETTAIGPLQMRLTVDPAVVGHSSLRVYLSDPRDGAPFGDARDVTISASQPDQEIGPISDRPELTGPGRYTVSAMQFGVAGTWAVRVAVRVSDFDRYEAIVEVPVR